MEILKKDSILTICEDVAESSQVKCLSANEPLILPNTFSDKVYIIKSGLFKFGIGYGDMNFTVDFLLPGYVTGLVNLYQPTQYPCAIISVVDSVVYEWDRVKILELMSFVPEVSKEVRRSYSGWGVRIVSRIKGLVFYTVRQRVVSWVLDYHANPNYRANRVWQRLSVEDMASFCNVTIEEFNSELLRLVELGYVKVDQLQGCEVLCAEGLSRELAS